MKPLIYLAQAYSHPDVEGRIMRFNMALRVAAGLMNQGHILFSPIAHTHPIAQEHDLPKGWDFWKEMDETILSKCDEMWIIDSDGWQESKGVAAEIAFSIEHNIPISLVDPVTLKVERRSLGSADGGDGRICFRAGA